MGEVYHLNIPKYQELQLEIRSSCYALFGNMSDRVMGILANYTDDIEVYSVDYRSNIRLVACPKNEQPAQNVIYL